MSIISMLSGIAVFLYGMLLLSSTLKESAGEKLKNILSRFTSDRFSCVASGAVITALMQSSSASTVMTAALVDNGILSLYKAGWIVVGANIGTTLTGVLTSFEFSSFAPFACVLGLVLISFIKKSRCFRQAMLLLASGCCL